MHLFGCKFHELDAHGQQVPRRQNFDSLFWATVTVFQVLTQSDWNEVLYAGMERVGPWASLYFLLLMVFGNYVLFSLLVAILVEGFSETADEPAAAAGLVVSVNTHYHEILGALANIPDSEPLTLATIKALPSTSSASTPQCKFYK